MEAAAAAIYLMSFMSQVMILLAPPRGIRDGAYS